MKILIFVIGIGYSSASPYIIKDGCPFRNPTFTETDGSECKTDWILAMCPCSKEDCASRPSSNAPTCTIRSPTCTPQPTYNSGAPSTGEPLIPTSSPTFITTVVETVINKKTNTPNVSPSFNPSDSPSEYPSVSPSVSPSDSPSDSPSEYPTWISTSKEKCPLSS